MATRRKAFSQILTTALLFSTGGAVIKSCDLTSWQIASFRSGIAVVTLLLLMPSARRRWTARTVAVGCAYATTMILFVHANKLTTAASTIFLQGSAPLYVVLLGPWLLRERVQRRDLLLMLILIIGLGLFILGADEPFETAPNPVAGNILAALSGVTWALTLIGLRWLAIRSASRPSASRATEPGTATAVVCGNTLACLVALPMALPVAEVAVGDWLAVLYLGVFQIGVAYVLLTVAIGSLSALEASLLLLAEPAMSPLWAWLVHGERPGLWTWLGGALILSATVAKALAGRTSVDVSSTGGGIDEDG